MKKLNIFLLLITSLCLVYSCSSDDDSIENQYTLNPPNWIQGEWFLMTPCTTTCVGWKFSLHDACTINVPSGNGTCFGNNTNYVTEEVITSTQYKFTYVDSEYLPFEFVKLSNTKIKYLKTGQVYTKQ